MGLIEPTQVFNPLNDRQRDIRFARENTIRHDFNGVTLVKSGHPDSHRKSLC